MKTSASIATAIYFRSCAGMVTGTRSSCARSRDGKFTGKRICLRARYCSRTSRSSKSVVYIDAFLTFCLWFSIDFFCVLRSRDGKYTGKKIFDGSSVYVRASVTKWRAGAKVLTLNFNRFKTWVNSLLLIKFLGAFKTTCSLLKLVTAIRCLTRS